MANNRVIRNNKSKLAHKFFILCSLMLFLLGISAETSFAAVSKSSSLAKPLSNTSKKTTSKTNTQKATATKTVKSETAKTTKVAEPKKQNISMEKNRSRVSEPIIKVKIGSTQKTVSITFAKGGQLINSKGKRVKTIKANGIYTWSTPSAADLKDKKKRKKIEFLDETITFKSGDNILKLGSNEYRGKLIIKFTESGATVVNELGIEDYLRGVVGSEIGSLSPDESLKAQTVIARTYAYANKGRHSSDGADVCNSTHCQVYSGKKAERESIDKAVKATRGIIVTHKSNPISALYHATCGGMTSNNEEVWGGAPLPYLRRVQCPFCTNGTKYRWNQTISINDLRSALAKEGVKLDTAYDVSIEAPSKLDRVTNMVFKTSNGVQKIKGTTVRRIFDLPSTTFVINDQGKNKSSATPISSPRIELAPPEITMAPGVVITDFDERQSSPKQILVYCAGGLVRCQMPSDGWKCISYSPTGKKIVKSKSEMAEEDKARNRLEQLANSKRSNIPVTSVSLFGRGFGHQVGLCQSGAVEMGKRNWNYRQILAHYYKEVALKKLGY